MRQVQRHGPAQKGIKCHIRSDKIVGGGTDKDRLSTAATGGWNVVGEEPRKVVAVVIYATGEGAFLVVGRVHETADAHLSKIVLAASLNCLFFCFAQGGDEH